MLDGYSGQCLIPAADSPNPPRNDTSMPHTLEQKALVLFTDSIIREKVPSLSSHVSFRMFRLDIGIFSRHHGTTAFTLHIEDRNLLGH